MLQLIKSERVHEFGNRKRFNPNSSCSGASLMPMLNTGHAMLQSREFMSDLMQIAGIVGSILIIIAFFSNQQGWMKSRSLPYVLLNLAGSLCIIASLIDAWNFPSFVIEAFWAMISVYGLARRLRFRQR
jgi:hypothetical protein